ncbi:MAG: cytochrome P450 [Pseudomonadota bacterium]
MIKIVFRNPIEVWDESAYREPYVFNPNGMGGPLLVANDTDLIRHTFIEHADSFKMSKVRQLVLRPLLRDGLITAEGNIWKRARKTISPIFTPRHVQGFANAIHSTTEAFAERYGSASQPVDMSQDMTLLTFEILSACLFSNQIVGDPDTFVEQIEILFQTAGKIDPLDIVAAPAWMPRISRLPCRKPLAYFRKLISDTVELRKMKIAADEEIPDDFLSLLLQFEGGDGLSRDEIEDNVMSFIGAGHETTARALCWTFYLLARAPEEREKVEKEVKRVTAKIKNPAQWLDAMPYTKAVFEEVMRLYPPVSSISREAMEDVQWRDLTIKKGTQLFVIPWTIHRHRSNWEEPDAFNPSRFLPGNREKLHRYQYLPFGLGPRVCIGARFAMQEAAIVLGVLLSRYRFDMVADAPDPWPVQKMTTQPRDPLMMTSQRL